MRIVFYSMITALLCIFISPAASAGTKPSFNCTQASTRIEKTICTNPGLAARDAQLARLYTRFLDDLPGDSRRQARQIQRLWLHNREIRCGRMKLPLVESMYSNSNQYDHSALSGADALEELPFELPATPASNMASCLTKYYDFSIDSLQKGFLSSEFYLVDGVKRYPINFRALRSVNVEVMSRDQSGNEPLQLDVQLETDDGQVLSSKIRTEYSDGTNILGIRLIMSSSGATAVALKTIDYTRGGTCGYHDGMSLQFYRVTNAGIEKFSGKTKGGIPLLDATYTCSQQMDKAIEWHGDGNTLSYTYREMVNNIFAVSLPVLNVYSVNMNTGSSESRPYLSTDTRMYRGLTYEELWNDFTKKRASDYAPHDHSTCTEINRQIYRYIDLKVYAASKSISRKQLFFIMEKAWTPGRFKAAVHEFAPAAKVFLDYLQKARTVTGWRQKASKYANSFPGRNDHGFIMGPYPEHGYLAKEGFPSNGACFINTRSPAAGVNLEEWIYLFWYRRAADGTLPKVEKYLHKAIELDHHN